MARKKKTKKRRTKKKLVSEKTKKFRWSDLNKTVVTKQDWTVILLFVAAVFMLALMAGVVNLVNDGPLYPGIATPMSFGLPKEVVADDTVDFISEYMVPPEVGVEFVSIVEESGVYKLTVLLKTDDQQFERASYVSKDGKLFFIEPINMAEVRAQPMPQQQTAAVFDAPDVEKPTIKFFVMSFCPYGLQAEEGLEPVYQVLGDSVNWEPHFVVYENYGGGGPDYCIDNGTLCSMHGIDELMENVRQLCVYNNYGTEAFWKYVKYVFNYCTLDNINECWLDAADYAGVDTDEVSTCADEQAVDLMRAERELNVEYGVRGSPTIFVNDAQYSGGRAADDYKDALCSGFINQPEVCNEKISDEVVAATGSC